MKKLARKVKFVMPTLTPIKVGILCDKKYCNYYSESKKHIAYLECPFCKDVPFSINGGAAIYTNYKNKKCDLDNSILEYDEKEKKFKRTDNCKQKEIDFRSEKTSSKKATKGRNTKNGLQSKKKAQRGR